jgi:hypothetical protein
MGRGRPDAAQDIRGVAMTHTGARVMRTVVSARQHFGGYFFTYECGHTDRKAEYPSSALVFLRFQRGEPARGKCYKCSGTEEWKRMKAIER